MALFKNNLTISTDGLNEMDWVCELYSYLGLKYPVIIRSRLLACCPQVIWQTHTTHFSLRSAKYPHFLWSQASNMSAVNILKSHKGPVFGTRGQVGICWLKDRQFIHLFIPSLLLMLRRRQTFSPVPKLFTQEESSRHVGTSHGKTLESDKISKIKIKCST